MNVKLELNILNTVPYTFSGIIIINRKLYVRIVVI